MNILHHHIYSRAKKKYSKKKCATKKVPNWRLHLCFKNIFLFIFGKYQFWHFLRRTFFLKRPSRTKLSCKKNEDFDRELHYTTTCIPVKKHVSQQKRHIRVSRVFEIFFFIFAKFWPFLRRTFVFPGFVSPVLHCATAAQFIEPLHRSHARNIERWHKR